MSPIKINTRRQTERALLGSVLAHPEILEAKDFPYLAPDDFATAGHRAVWCAITTLKAASQCLLPADVATEMERAGAGDLAELNGLATEVDLLSALENLVREADAALAIEHAATVRTAADNWQLADRLGELVDKAKAWPPFARAFFCDAFSDLATLFCGAAHAGAL